jgi:FkbM family methyltransferase
MANPLFGAVRDFFARRGYPIIPEWRLEKWDQSTHLAQLFTLLGIDCVLDVGANIGQYHEFLRLHMDYGGDVVSFEPVQEMYDVIARASAADPKWSVHKFALGESDRGASINVLAERTLTSLLPRNEQSLRSMGYEKYVRETELDRTETVEVRRLDGLIESIVPAGRRVFLKSDTQGYDMQVIRGAGGCLDRLLAIQVELPVREVYQGAGNYLEALAELTGMGFDPTGFFPVQRDRTLRIVNVDAVMVRHDEAERLRATREIAGRP